VTGDRQPAGVQRPAAPLPTHADVNLTNACNLACAHCHASSGHKLPGELSTDEFREAISALHALGVLSVVVAGGEPFARRDVVEILAHACGLPGWQVAVVTNGIHLDRKAAELAERCPNLDVNVSIDGSTAERFATLRRQRGGAADPGWAFRGACDGARASVEAGLRTSVNFTMTKPTIGDTRETYALATEELGAASMVAIKFFPAGYGKDNLARLELPFQKWSEEFAQLTLDKLTGELSRLQVSVPAPWEFYLPLIQADIDVAAAEASWGYRAPLREPLYAASASIGDVTGRREIALAPNGDVYPSVLTMGAPGAACGNLRRDPLERILSAGDPLAQLRALELEALAGGCSDCGLAQVCGGGSRVRAWDRVGSWSAADGSCPLTSAAPGAPGARREPPEVAFPRRSAVLGSGPEAIRVFRFADRSELRFRGNVVRCDSRTTRLLDELLAAEEEA